MKKDITIKGKVNTLWILHDEMEIILSLLSCPKFNSLFLDWYKDQSDDTFKKFKHYAKEHLSAIHLDSLKIIIKDYAGIQLPYIKIVDSNKHYKIAIRVGFGIDIIVKEVE